MHRLRMKIANDIEIEMQMMERRNCGPILRKTSRDAIKSGSKSKNLKMYRERLVNVGVIKYHSVRRFSFL